MKSQYSDMPGFRSGNHSTLLAPWRRSVAVGLLALTLPLGLAWAHPGEGGSGAHGGGGAGAAHAGSAHAEAARHGRWQRPFRHASIQRRCCALQCDRAPFQQLCRRRALLRPSGECGSWIRAPCADLRRRLPCPLLRSSRERALGSRGAPRWSGTHSDRPRSVRPLWRHVRPRRVRWLSLSALGRRLLARSRLASRVKRRRFCGGPAGAAGLPR